MTNKQDEIKELVEILKATPLGRGVDFKDGSYYLIYLRNWRIRKKELLLLAQAIHSAGFRKQNLSRDNESQEDYEKLLAKQGYVKLDKNDETTKENRRLFNVE